MKPNSFLLLTTCMLALSACGQDSSPAPVTDDHGEESGQHAGEGETHAPDDHARDEHAPGEDGDDEHAADGHETESRSVRLTEAQQAELGIQMAPVSSGPVAATVELPGEVVFDQTQLAHVAPRVSGIVRQVNAAEGDEVEAGEVLAVLESRPLADAKAEYLSARERLALAEASFNREQRLWERQISAEQDFLDARQALEEARITLRRASQQLEALGVDAQERRDIAASPEASLTRYDLVAPITGTVIERHAVLGETLESQGEQPAFIIADTSTVWINAAIYGEDLARVNAGDSVLIEVGEGIPAIEETIEFVSPQLGERTRTGRARIVVEDAGERLRPGMFVTVFSTPADALPALRVPVSALQTIEGETVVFRAEDDAFHVQRVEVGSRSSQFAEITSGLTPGATVVTEGAFALKAELQKGEFGDGHAH
ncbi:cytochrome-c peroxidase [Marinicauda pacifica]|jgi:membrane fusion protein, heavy metal efflux system|uniref:Efflux RND transporter periplasmic adaptor subunit n=1 Tax=Marinicauda pacifica TaxID=1133559 RepID=A0A4V6RFA7_9PROT|nr:MULTISPECIES: efflux RND transporter periplasmic adaptor subunit [Marinicauda]TGY94829.1 efflux RND transporter periplasmic adaptor subunit [Marinicauda pacifica]GGE39184.1 cytochrome-c peroxidase [Marinicauda pacifica]